MFGPFRNRAVPRTPVRAAAPLRTAAPLRAAALAAVAGTALASLAACGGSSSSAGASGGSENYAGKTLTVEWGANASHPDQLQAWQNKIAQEFKAQTGANLAWDLYSTSGNEETKIQTSVVANSGPDVFSVGTTFVPVAMGTGGFRTLTDEDWKIIGGKQEFFAPQLRMSGPDPSHYIGVPIAMRPYGLVYNTELFSKAGITKPPVTWNEFIEDAQKLTDASAGVYGTEIDPADTYDPWKIWWTFTRQLGSDFLSKDLKKAQLDSPEAKQAVQFWFDWLTKYHVVNPHAVTWKTADALTAFSNGKMGMLPEVTPTVKNTLDKSAVKGKYAFAPMPSVPYGMDQRPAGGDAAESIVSGQDVVVAKWTKYPKLADKFIALLTSKDNQLEWSKTFGDLPITTAAADELAASDPQVKAFITAEEQAVPTPLSGEWGDLEVALGAVSQKLAGNIAANHYSPDQVGPLLTAANTQVQRQLH